MEATEGGTRRHLRDLAMTLDPSEFRLELAVSCLRDPDFRHDLKLYAERGITAHEIPMRRDISPFRDLLSLCRLVSCIRAIRPEVVHAHSSKAGALARIAGMLCGVPVVYTPHGMPFLMRRRRFISRFYRLIERFLANWTAVIIAVSDEERQACLTLGYAPNRVRLIPNGVMPGDERDIVIRNTGVLQIGFFGRLALQKAPDTLLDAAAEVISHMPQTFFTFYGDGDLAPKLSEMIRRMVLSSHVRLAGAYGQSDAVSLMRQMDVVAVPSLWEGCPYVVLEAFQAGVPVVAARVGGICDLIVDGANGILTEAGSAESLCDGLLRVLRDAGLRERLARRGREELGRHTLAAMAAAVAAVYRQAAGGAVQLSETERAESRS